MAIPYDELAQLAGFAMGGILRDVSEAERRGYVLSPFSSAFSEAGTLAEYAIAEYDATKDHRFLDLATKLVHSMRTGMDRLMTLPPGMNAA